MNRDAVEGAFGFSVGHHTAVRALPAEPRMPKLWPNALPHQFPPVPVLPRAVGAD